VPGAAAPTGTWLGPAPTGAQVAATFFAGIAGIMFAGVGPLLLGGLHQAGRLTASQLGQAGTAELLTMGIGAGVTGALVGGARLRALVMLCGLAMAALNAATMMLDGWTLVAARAVNGLPSGSLVWLMTAMIVRAPRPERWSAIYLTLQGIAQFAMLTALGAWVLGPFGANGGFAALAVLGGLTVIAGLVVPRGFAPLPVAADEPSGLPAPRGLVALAAAFCFNAAILALWIYLEPLSRQAGNPAGTADIAFSLSLAAQVVGGTVATLLAGRVRWFPPLILSLVAMIALMGAYALLPGAMLFLAVSTAFGFLWMLASPFLTPLAIEADPTRRAAVLGSGAALLGCSSGPFLASLTVSETDLRGACAMGIALMIVAVAIVVALHATRRAHRVTLAA
jgi:predicted MFS family arabinose efflux permease